MFRSPIPDSFWQAMFRVTALGFGTAIIFSLLNQRRLAHSQINAPLAVLAKKEASAEEIEDALKRIYQQVEEEKSGHTKGATLLTIQSYFGRILNHIAYDGQTEDTSRRSMIVLKILESVCESPDDGSRRALQKAGGYRKMLALVANAHKVGNTNLMIHAASTLENLTHVDESEIILWNDVPAGAVGTQCLIGYGATVSMLRTLDSNARALFLIHVSGIFANIATLSSGAQAIAKGVDGQSAASFFFKLLDIRGNVELIERSTRALQGLCVHCPKEREEFLGKENIAKIVSLLEPIHSKATLEALLKIVHTLADDKVHGDNFVTKFNETRGVNGLIHVWTKGGDKGVRDTAEELVQHLKLKPSISANVRKILDESRGEILARKRKDEDQKKQALAEMQQNRMAQMQMMMAQMGGGGGGGDEDDDM